MNHVVHIPLKPQLLMDAGQMKTKAFVAVHQRADALQQQGRVLLVVDVPHRSDVKSPLPVPKGKSFEADAVMNHLDGHPAFQVRHPLQNQIPDMGRHEDQGVDVFQATWAGQSVKASKL